MTPTDPKTAPQPNVAQPDSQSDEPEREVLLELPLTHGGHIRIFAETFGGPPSLRLEKAVPGRERQPMNFAISSNFSAEFSNAVTTWLRRIDEAKARIAKQPTLHQRQNRSR